MKFTLFLLITMTFSSYKIESACISKANLEDLGFSDVLETPVDNTTADATNKVCKTFEKVCVNPEKLKEQGMAILENYKDSIKSQLGSVKKVHSHLTKKLLKLSKAWADETKKPKVIEKFSLTTEDQTQIDELVKKCTETECKILEEDQIEDMESNKECFKSLMNYTIRGTCFLLSDSSSDFFTAPNSEKLSKVAVNQDAAKSVFDSCVNYVDVQCSLVNLFGIYRKMIPSPPERTSNRAAKFEETCKNISKLVT